MQSNLLKPWNDHEKLTFKKIPDSSYFLIDDSYPIPSCSAKQSRPVYTHNLNDRYLSLAVGTENFKFRERNANEENVFKAEDTLYMFETKLDSIEKSIKIVTEILVEFNELPECEKSRFQFPVHRLKPHIYNWDSKLKFIIKDQFLRKDSVIKLKDILNLRQILQDRLEHQKKQRNH